MASNDSDDDYIGHPLFPIPMDRVVSARRRFDLVQIHRILPDKNTRETCPVLFIGSELRSWQQILDMFGGECYYQLQGVCSKTRRYTARSERWFFSSPARKPFVASAQLPAIESPSFPVPSQNPSSDVRAQFQELLLRAIVDGHRFDGVTPEELARLLSGSI